MSDNFHYQTLSLNIPALYNDLVLLCQCNFSRCNHTSRTNLIIIINTWAKNTRKPKAIVRIPTAQFSEARFSKLATAHHIRSSELLLVLLRSHTCFLFKYFIKGGF